jgi:predicted transcriptional regulator
MTPIPAPTITGHDIYRMRRSYGIRQHEIARHVGYSTRYIRLLEQGKRPLPIVLATLLMKAIVTLADR